MAKRNSVDSFRPLMKRTSVFLWLLLCLAITFGCSTPKGQSKSGSKSGQDVLRILQEVQTKHAPDHRMAIFQVKPEHSGHSLILRGEVDNRAAKDELVARLEQAGINAVDQITVLPADNLGASNWAIVRISVANVRDEKGNGAEMGTQVLMGHAIRLWKNEGGWYYVQSSDHYLGWTDDDCFVRVTKEQVNEWNAAPRLIVTDYEDRIWEQPGGKRPGNLPVTDVVAGCLLGKVGQEGDWLRVKLPDGRSGYLAKESAMDFELWKKSRQPTSENIEKAARSLMGVPYLWGGTSTKGVDCSGFTKTVYSWNGIDLLRNASHQARFGTEIDLDPDFSHLKKGDLLFFGSRGGNGRTERVSHVGIYLEDKSFIHSSGLVKINSLDPKSPVYDEHRHKTLIKVRRYLPGT